MLAELLPQRLAQALAERASPAIADRPACRTGTSTAWRRCSTPGRLPPAGSEGYAKAEVTLGGVDTAALSSRDHGSQGVPGLYFIGEAVDVTGWLGGYNFQWAWSSGHCAGQFA